jgi:GntR family transcriptional regulator, arabinose operon transcriptional repressor
MKKALAKALQTIEMLVEECKKKKTARLPTTVELAKKAGVSVPTMTKALRIAVHQKAIKTSPKSGITVNPGADFRPPRREENRPPLPKWQSLIKEIEKEIIPRLTSVSPLLPSSKELSHRFGVAHVTLQKALGKLVRIGRLQRYKKGYRIHSQFPVPGKKKIIAVLPFNLTASHVTTEPVFYELLHILETICIFNNLYLDFLVSDAGGVVDNRSSASIHKHSDEILGFIVFSQINEHCPLFNVLNSSGKPVAILNSDNPNCRLPFGGSSRFKVFTVGLSVNSGSKAAFFLKDHGHSRIAYLSIFHDFPWSQSRLKGISYIYDRLGHGYSVTPFCTPTPDFDALREKPDGWLTKKNKDEPIGYRSNRYTFQKPVEKICRRALEHKEITAWIAANDYIALDAIDYLKKREIAVPEDISIIGFDDCFESLNYQLTTYNFNSPALMHAMYNFIADSQKSDKIPKQTSLVDCMGYIVERRTAIARSDPSK